MRFRSSALCAALAAVLAAGVAQAAPVTYTMDPGHTDVVVRWSHFGYSRPSAMFTGITGTVTYDPANPQASSVQVSVPLASVHTASDKLDEHLQHSDFFDAAKWPVATFKSTKVVPGGDANELQVTGDFTLHGVTKPVTMEVTINKIGERHGKRAAAFDADFHIIRSEFGVGRYAPMVSDRIDIEATTEAMEEAAAEPASATATKPAAQGN